MDRTFAVSAVQYLSRECGIAEGETVAEYDSIPYEGASYRIAMRLQVGGWIARQRSSDLGAVLRPPSCLPWAERPSIGAHQPSDPYNELRWPRYLHFHGVIELVRANPLALQEWVDCTYCIQELLWGAIRECPDLSVLKDQRMVSVGCRWSYVSTMIDIWGSPFPADGEYVLTEIGEPTGPGCVQLPDLFLNTDSMPIAGLSLLWSQGIHLPAGRTAEDIERRVRKFQTHYNSLDEIRLAERSAERGDRKTTVRSSASAVEAAINFYCAEWGVTLPTDRRLNFLERIDAALGAADRPRYSDVDPRAAEDVLHLYQARNSMHEGACWYRDPGTGKSIDVDLAIARGFLQSARAFVLWLDSVA